MQRTMATIFVVASAGCAVDEPALPADTGVEEFEIVDCPPANRYAWIGTDCGGKWRLAHQLTFLYRGMTSSCIFWTDGGGWGIHIKGPAPGGEVWAMRKSERVARGTWTVQPGTETTPELVLVHLPRAADGQYVAPFSCEKGDGIVLLAPAPH